MGQIENPNEAEWDAFHEWLDEWAKENKLNPSQAKVLIMNWFDTWNRSAILEEIAQEASIMVDSVLKVILGGAGRYEEREKRLRNLEQMAPHMGGGQREVMEIRKLLIRLRELKSEAKSK